MRREECTSHYILLPWSGRCDIAREKMRTRVREKEGGWKGERERREEVEEKVKEGKATHDKVVGNVW